jgi:hypothetical protein
LKIRPVPARERALLPAYALLGLVLGMADAAGKDVTKPAERLVWRYYFLGMARAQREPGQLG